MHPESVAFLCKCGRRLNGYFFDNCDDAADDVKDFVTCIECGEVYLVYRPLSIQSLYRTKVSDDE